MSHIYIIYVKRIIVYKSFYFETFVVCPMHQYFYNPNLDRNNTAIYCVNIYV